MKICGIERAESLDIAIEYGADFIGFVFYSPSPRNLTPEKAKRLKNRIPKHVTTVGLFVDPTNSEIDDVLAAIDLDLIQLHGDENPSRVLEIKRQTHLPILKAIRLGSHADLAISKNYYEVADHLLFDAKVPTTSPKILPGGNAISFDWKILNDVKIPLPWMLAGGLNCQNIREAVEATGANTVDVSSGVEKNPGIKDLELIMNFLTVAKML